jgi:hypothetical protein
MRIDHTSGPWIVKNTPEDYNTGVYTDDEGHGIGGVNICITNKRVHAEIANARLIAAAPDLLAALKETLLILETHPKILNGATARFAAQRAIARAEGRTR